MSTGSLKIDTALVEQLTAGQFPHWADLAVDEVQPNGWDNRTFRLGENMSVRLPSAERYVAQVLKEHRWLPVLARQLPLRVPTPLAIGEPGAGYPWEWSVNGWIEGETAMEDRIGNMPEFAAGLAGFLTSLQRIDVAGAPAPGKHNFYRGGDLCVYDEQTREAIKLLERGSDPETSSLTEVWDFALESTWRRPPVWIHGDVSSGNLLVNDGRLSAVIDWGGTAVGDPACDLAIAWTMFDGESREAFHSNLDLDDATWARARGWTLWKALIILSGISETNAVEAELARRTVDRILADYSCGA